MFNVLRNCFKSFSQSTSSDPNSSYPSPTQNYIPPNPPKPSTQKRMISLDRFTSDDNLPDPKSFNYMTLDEAKKHHKYFYKNQLVGNLKIAYKCFEAYAKLDQINAKYYKAYYLLKGYDESDLSDAEKEKIAAQLFKEVADQDEVNEFPMAKIRYGNCLYHGKGVEKDLPEALKYFERAADN